MSIVSQLVTSAPKKVTLRATEQPDKDIKGQLIGMRGNTVTQIIMPLNPESLSSVYNRNFFHVDSVSPANSASDKKKTPPLTQGSSPFRMINADFMLDETLPVELLGTRVSVREYIEALELLCAAKTSEDAAVWIWMEWGEVTYKGQVSNLSIQQLLFNRAGAPIQARVSLTLTEAVVSAVLKKGNGLDRPSLPGLEATNLTSLLALLGTGTSGMIAVPLQSSLIDTNNDFIQIASDNDLDSLNALSSDNTLIVGS